MKKSRLREIIKEEINEGFLSRYKDTFSLNSREDHEHPLIQYTLNLLDERIGDIKWVRIEVNPYMSPNHPLPIREKGSIKIEYGTGENRNGNETIFQKLPTELLKYTKK